MSQYINIDPFPDLPPLEQPAQSWLRKTLGDIAYFLNNRLLSNSQIGWKSFSGTTDADSQTTFAHGLTQANILGAVCSVYNGTIYVLGDVGSGGYAAGDLFRYYVNGANFVLDDMGANVQGQAYRVLIFYVD